MELGGTRENRKKHFFQLWIFLGNSRYLAEARRGINSEEMKNNFLVQNTWNIGFETWVPRSLTMQLMPQLFLR